MTLPIKPLSISFSGTHLANTLQANIRKHDFSDVRASFHWSLLENGEEDGAGVNNGIWGSQFFIDFIDRTWR
jgi:hypothetical protein